MLLSSLQTSVAKTQESHRAILVRDINKILIASLRSAWNFRRLNVGKYALQDRSTLEPWTGSCLQLKTLII